jgi:hypothetical protein
MSRCSQILAISFVAGLVSAGAIADEASHAAARQYLAAGTQAFQKGEFQSAVEALSAAMPELDEEQTAKARYLRARALRAMGKPASSLSDFDNALASSDVLSAAERVAARRERSFAYSEAGLTGDESAVAGEAPIVLMAPSSPIDTASLPPERVPLEGWSAAAVKEREPPAPKPEVSTPFTTEVASAPQTHEGASDAKPVQSRAPAPVAVAAPVWGAPDVSATPMSVSAPAEAQAAAGAAADTKVSDGAVASGASGQSGPTANAPEAVAGIAGKASGSAGLAEGAGSAQVAATAPAIKPAEPKIAATAREEQPDAAPAGSSRTMLNIGTVRTQSEAYALTVRAVSLVGHQVGGGRLSIVATDGGNAYKVLLGPYADPEVGRSVCEQLRTTSYDCAIEGDGAPARAVTMPVDVAELPPVSQPGASR